jgi:hypothetical protein
VTSTKRGLLYWRARRPSAGACGAAILRLHLGQSVLNIPTSWLERYHIPCVEGSSEF